MKTYISKLFYHAYKTVLNIAANNINSSIMLKMYCNYCMVSFQGSELISPCKKTRNRSNYSSFPVQEDANISVKGLCKKTLGAFHRPFKCTDCDYAASKSSHLKCHKTNVHKQLKPFKCTDCSYGASQSFLLKSHITCVHKCLKRFKCSECDYAASKSDTLKRHINSVHKRLRPFNCSECDYAASQKSTLKYHLNNVHKRL